MGETINVTQAEWEAAMNALPKKIIDPKSTFGDGWNSYAFELISEGFLMEVLQAAAKARAINAEE